MKRAQADVQNLIARAASLLSAALLLVTPALALAGEDGGHGFSLKVHGFYIINFAIFVAIIAVTAGPAIARAVRERSANTARRLTQAEAAARQASTQAQDARQKVHGLEDDKAALIKRMHEEGLTLEEKIRQRAAQEAQKIQKGAEQALVGEKARLDKQVMTEVALAALDKAELQLKATWQELPHERLVADFSNGLATVQLPRQEKAR